MKRPMTRLWEGVLLLALTVLLFWYPSESAQAAQQGITLCGDLLIPSLFPFFVLSSLMISTGMAGWLTRPLQKLTAPLLGVSGAGAAALLLGAVGGYPVGARTLAQLSARGECSPAETRRLSLFCNNCGPAFFIGAAGVGVFGAKEAGFRLLGVNLAAALVIGMVLRVVRGPVHETDGRSLGPSPHVPLSEAFPECVQAAFASTLGVCTYVILFSVLTTLADCSGLLPLCQRGLSELFPGQYTKALSRAFCVGLLEVSTGTAALRDAASSSAALPMAAFLLGWGGLSVHGQTLPFLREAKVPAGPYLAAKLVQGILAAAGTAFGMKSLPLALPAMAPLGDFAAPSLLGRELLVLWAAAGLYFFVSWVKRGGKPRQNPL